MTNLLLKSAKYSQISFSAFAIMLFTLLSINVHAQFINPTGFSNPGGRVPAGWTEVETTDVSNKDFWNGNSAYPWVGMGLSTPPNGDLSFISGTRTEVVGTTITGLTSGVSYTLTFYAAEAQALTGSAIQYNFDGSLRVSTGTGGTFQDFDFFGGPNSDWMTIQWTFVASATTQVVDFSYKPYVISEGVGNLWNLSVSPDAVKVTTAPCAAGSAAPQF